MVKDLPHFVANPDIANLAIVQAADHVLVYMSKHVVRLNDLTLSGMLLWQGLANQEVVWQT